MSYEAMPEPAPSLPDQLTVNDALPLVGGKALTLLAGVTNYSTLTNITILDSLTAMDTAGTAYGAAVVAADEFAFS